MGFWAKSLEDLSFQKTTADLIQMSERNAEKDFILDLEMKLKINEHFLDILFPLNINKQVRGIIASGELSVLRLYVVKSFLAS